MKRTLFLFALLAPTSCGQTTTTTEEPAAVSEGPAHEVAEAWPDLATDSVFSDRDIGDGIRIQYPSHWYILRADQSAEINARGRESAATAEPGTANKRTLIAINATPAPTGAMIRVSVTPGTIGERELEQALESNSADLLRSIRAEFEAHFPPTMRELGIEVSDIRDPQIVPIDGKNAILIAYRRTSAVDGGLWEVRLYQIPHGGRTIELTLSNRLSDREVWTPILDRTLRTISVVEP
jgi:hypothetical protein